MSRNRFQAIRGSFQIHPAYESNEDEMDIGDCPHTEATADAAEVAAAVKATTAVTDQDTAAAAAAEADSVVVADGTVDATESDAARAADIASALVMAAAA
ncbi:hypothetical protein PR003_g11157 [Phytophthora rubi]|uniref:Uncharacterized protein n=1 Tax=Phytophthora rubi TaxID=129364 RepID=A0A6A4F3S4_9STRA|nr:hypothetical protein PR001_g16072 [Phytophthora rubi]KAE9339134.1 hypothetical protein PR003_g11157 [Phytophthora rubi]